MGLNWAIFGFSAYNSLIHLIYNKVYMVITTIIVYKRDYMGEQVLTLVKIPIVEIEEWIRARHVLPPVLADFRIEEDNLVLYFSQEGTSKTDSDTQSPKTSTRRRRAHRKRNRMKTRGWEVVARITNSKGQECAIYKPFVEALQNPKLTFEEQKKAVEGILRSNRNRPSESSVRYFLENTLEYLKKGLENHVPTEPDKQ